MLLKKVSVQWLPELYINYPASVFFLVGCYTLKRSRNASIQRFLWLYMVPFGAYFVFFLPMFDMHDYYAIPVLPVLVIITVLGLKTASEFAQRRQWASKAVVGLLVLVPIVGSIRSLSRFEGASIDRDLMASEQYLDKIIPDKKALVIAASDDSPSTYLYFMHRKGWHATEPISAQDFLQMIQNGAKYLVSDSRNLEQRVDVRTHLSEISSCGRFKVFLLKE